MRTDVPNNFILNGIDRCGSSAISRILSRHPEIELVFQPFNSGPIRKIMYQIMDDDNTSEADHAFFKGLINNRLESGYIVSEWHRKYSTVQALKSDRIHVIKTTLNHFTIKWVQRYYPELELWGVWRDPLEILASIERNDFFDEWYKDALLEITPTVQMNLELRNRFGRFLNRIRNKCQATAFLIAARSYYYFLHLDGDKVLIYDYFKKDPNRELNRVCNYFDLDSFDFREHADQDLNVSGRQYQKNVQHAETMVTGENLVFAEAIFKPLHEWYKSNVER